MTPDTSIVKQLDSFFDSCIGNFVAVIMSILKYFLFRLLIFCLLIFVFPFKFIIFVYLCFCVLPFLFLSNTLNHNPCPYFTHTHKHTKDTPKKHAFQNQTLLSPQTDTCSLSLPLKKAFLLLFLSPVLW